MYACSCLDATLHNTVYKHAHLLHMLLSKNTQSNSSSPRSSQVITNFSSEPEEQSVVQGSEQNSETESKENTTGYTPEMKKVSDNDSLEPDISFEHPSTHDCSGSQENFNTTEHFNNLLRQDTAGNLAGLKSDTEDLTHCLLSLIRTSNDADAMATVKHHLKSSISIMESKSIIQQ